MSRDWGAILLGTRLEKQVTARFFQVWSSILTRGIAQGDGVLSERGKVAHKAANDLVRRFLLETECDSLLFIDSDADVDADIVDQFRRYQPGYEYDVLQAFYCRRGWPPTPIWMRKNALGEMTDVFVTPETEIEDVDICGLHCCIVRRQVFETMLGNDDPKTFEWFYYPRHKEDSEDGAFSLEAKAAGFRLGATTAIRAGHLSELSTNWESYQDWMRMTGRDRLIVRYRELAEAVAGYTGELPSVVVAKSMSGRDRVREAWARYAPKTAKEVRAFYGAPDNGYLYDLVEWNCQPLYERIINPLYDLRGKRALVIGAGLGTEIDVLLQNGNLVDVYELPGVLRDFIEYRFNDSVGMVDDLHDAKQGYDVIVAIDVLEHVHSDEIGDMLRAIDCLLATDGILIVHVAWGEGGNAYPQHFDHRTVVEGWLGEYSQIGEFAWQQIESGG